MLGAGCLFIRIRYRAVGRGRGSVCLIVCRYGSVDGDLAVYFFLAGKSTASRRRIVGGILYGTSLLSLLLFWARRVGGWRDGRYPGPDSHEGSDWGRNDDIAKG